MVISLNGRKRNSMKIIDPNRPAFPVVTRVKHPWTNRYNAYEDEVDDGVSLYNMPRVGKYLQALYGIRVKWPITRPA